MQVKISNGYSDTQHVEIVEPFAPDDFKVEEQEVCYDGKEIYKTVLFGLEAWDKVESVPLLADIKAQYDFPGSNFLYAFVGGGHAREFGKKKVLFGNLKPGDPKRDAKVEKIKAELEKAYEKGRVEFIAEFVVRANDRLREFCNRRIGEYKDEVFRVYSGENMSQKWIAEELDTPEILAEVERSRLALDTAREVYRQAMEMQKTMRNHKLLTMVQNDEGVLVEGNRVPESVEAEIITMLSENKAFEIKKGPFGRL